MNVRGNKLKVDVSVFEECPYSLWAFVVHDMEIRGVAVCTQCIEDFGECSCELCGRTIFYWFYQDCIAGMVVKEEDVGITLVGLDWEAACEI
jgi:hypothetical protein